LYIESEILMVLMAHFTYDFKINIIENRIK